jgi:hypothetical protein
VLLGADATPLGYPLARYLCVSTGTSHPCSREALLTKLRPLLELSESAGYIVIASVSTTAAAKALEKSANGFIRALVMDPDSVRT